MNGQMEVGAAVTSLARVNSPLITLCSLRRNCRDSAVAPMCTDSEILLCWFAYETVKLQVFNRNGVVNITRKIYLKKLFHIKGKENCSDVGIRMDKVSSNDIKHNTKG